jgi:hypothetical protein
MLRGWNTVKQQVKMLGANLLLLARDARAVPDERCVSGIAAMVTPEIPALSTIVDPARLKELRKLQEKLKEPFAAIDKTILPKDRSLTEAEMRLLHAAIGLEPK